MQRLKEFVLGIRLRGVSADGASNNKEGAFWSNLTTKRFKGYIDAAIRIFVTEDQQQTITNKTINVDNNTISNIEIDNFKTGVVDIDGTLAANSDVKIATQKATKTYANSVASSASAALSAHTSLSTAHGTTSTIVGISDGQILTNKTINATLNSISNINTTHLASGILDTDLTTVSLLDDTIPSAKATKTYADSISGGAATALNNHISNLSAHGIISGTSPLLSSQTNTSLINLSAYKSIRLLGFLDINSTFFATIDILIVKRSADYKISTVELGDVTGITFDITSGGILTYSSGSLTTGSIKYNIQTIG